MYFPLWAARLAPATAFLALMALTTLLTTGCSTLESVLPSVDPRPSVLKIDPSEAYALAPGEGARWVLFKLDIRSGVRRLAQTTSSASHAAINHSPEAGLWALFSQARERTRLEEFGSALGSIPSPLAFPSSTP
jgi:hypothetical protein